MHHAARSAMAAGALIALIACSKPPPAPPAPPPAPAVDPAAARDAAREKEVLEPAMEAYLYGYPLVSMELARRAMTNVARPTGALAPMGQLARQRAFPTPASGEGAAPEVDTLALQAWLDVSGEPWVLTVPEVKARYVLLSVHSAFTDVFATVGGRPGGLKAQRLAITGPGWKGKLPAGVTELKSPTGLVWLSGRVAATGSKKDLAEAHGVQDRFGLVPLSALGKKHPAPAGKPDPSVDGKTPVRAQVDGLDAVAYFKLLATLLKANPPAASDAAAVAALGRIGVTPGQDFDAGPLDSVALRALAGAPRAAQARLAEQAGKGRTSVNGWSLRAGGAGIDHLQRAAAAAAGLPAARPQDAVTAVAEADLEGQPLDGTRKRVIHFAKGQLPPARAYWSITLSTPQRALAANKLNRHALGSRDRLRFNKDGSLDLLVQKDSPGKGKEANWLPAPAGPYLLTLRLAWPHEKAPSVLDGSWKPPAVAPAK